MSERGQQATILLPPTDCRLASQLELVEAYVASLHGVGIHLDAKAVWPALRCPQRVGSECVPTPGWKQ